ncbi:hypothetical protein CEUSTIGMA_g9999.t1 [Chlamydomonas eustigma]|uniref:Microsomal glutathione S-transferase 1 n=1 Tax=Chlamydomonas eustigma TaxID=1157962 RepID=A0A250XHQ1_9CHLO|nr:hypothetical protein CEUSTIGMA_g9999.t1 [Chlamydomonas eustigma]|eukprot:GAX82573.1 hypothetical protein CEUSTIGMA_g9999.t1 [Chlamydomonas eustigma]
MESTDFSTFLAKVAAFLVMKSVTTSLLIVRSRLITKDYSTGRYFLAKEDVVTHPKSFEALFKLLTCSVGPALDIGRLTGYQNNCVSNELFFLVLALCLTQSGNQPSWATQSLTLFPIFRVVHMLAYLTAAPQPLRGLSWTGGVLCTVALALAAFS